MESDGPKAFTDGSHRTVSPAETLARIRPLLRPLGITRVANVTGLDVLGVPVVVVCRPNSRSLSVSQGKGPTLEAAKVSGIMESLELFHAERPAHPLRLASYRELRLGEHVVPVETLDRPDTSLFTEHLRLLWVQGFDVVAQEPLWIPYEVVHMDCTVPMPPGSGCFHLNSNGLASGNHSLEALSQAICEVIERDSHAGWHALDEARRRETRVDLASVSDLRCVEILDRFEAAGFDAAVWDMTGPIGIAAFRAEIREREPREGGVRGSSSGMGCHAAREVALLRALTEAAQSRVTWISGARDDLFRRDFEEMRAPSRGPGGAPARSAAVWEIENHPRRMDDVPTAEFDTFDQEVRWQLERLQVAGMDRVIAVDLTHPGLQIPVVRVTIPGLRHPRPIHVAPARRNVHDLRPARPA